jgi:hypothetical protein
VGLGGIGCPGPALSPATTRRGGSGRRGAGLARRLPGKAISRAPTPGPSRVGTSSWASCAPRPPSTHSYERTAEGKLPVEKAKVNARARSAASSCCAPPMTRSARRTRSRLQAALPVERGWRDMKGALKLRPVFHSREDPVGTDASCAGWRSFSFARSSSRTEDLVKRPPRARPHAPRHPRQGIDPDERPDLVAAAAIQC